MTDLPIRAFHLTAAFRAELATLPPDPRPLQPDEVAGPTVCTLISPGTELAIWAQERTQPTRFGYAAVFRIAARGAAVTDVNIGDLAFVTGNHISWQRHIRPNIAPLPPGLPPQQAVFARLVGVSWASLVTTQRRPPDRVLVTGLGPVGNLAAQLFRAAGYHVTAVDPAPARRQLAARHGIPQVLAAVPADQAFHLALECSGVEQAVLDAARVLVKGGELSLVGVPWKRRSDVQAFDLLHAVFHRYIVLRSGWEWQVTIQPAEFRVGSHMAYYSAALEWLQSGKLLTDGLAEPALPHDPQALYTALSAAQGAPTRVVDWSRLGEPA